MEVVHLNAPGTQAYFDTYGETIYQVSKDSGPVPEEWRQRTQAERDEVWSMSSCT